MSTQIAIRLSDDVVAFIDDLVRRGEAPSRAAVVARALHRERRRTIGEQDVETLRRARDSDPNRELDALAQFAASTPLNDLD